MAGRGCSQGASDLSDGRTGLLQVKETVHPGQECVQEPGVSEYPRQKTLQRELVGGSLLWMRMPGTSVAQDLLVMLSELTSMWPVAGT